VLPPVKTIVGGRIRVGAIYGFYMIEIGLQCIFEGLKVLMKGESMLNCIVTSALEVGNWKFCLKV
jgi:hypothetical protein